MTDQQIKYWQMKSTAELNESSRARNYADVQKSYSDIARNKSEIDKILAQIQQIQADTALTQVERDKKAAIAWAEEWTAWMRGIFDPFGIAPGIAKGVTTLIAA